MGNARTTWTAVGVGAAVVAGGLLARAGVSVADAAGAVTPSAVAAKQQAAVYACVAKRGGAMRQVRKSTRCAGGERKISWPGTAGVGPAGPPGAVGPQGPVGPSAAYQAVAEGPATALPTSGALALVGRRLPAGSYVVTATAVLAWAPAAVNPSAVAAYCDLTVDGVPVSPATNGSLIRGIRFVNPAVPHDQQVALTRGITVTADQTVALACSAGDPGVSAITDQSAAVLTAVRVGSLDTTP